MEEKKISILTKISVLIFIVLAAFISWAIFQQVNKKKEIQKEISQLQDEAEKISRENISAQERISYFSSPDYQQREAKNKLNLKNPEEKVVIVKPEIAKKETAENNQTQGEDLSNKSSIDSNPIKWWHYFFNYE